MNKECGVCKWWDKEHCSNGESKHCTYPRLEIETCGHWEFFDLLPCPWCGGKGEIGSHRIRMENRRYYMPHIFCKDCGATSGWNDITYSRHYKENVKLAVEAWNRRSE